MSILPRHCTLLFLPINRPLISTVLVSAGMKTTVSEAEHPLLCEGTRRVKGDLALALMITYKDDQGKLKKVSISFDVILTVFKLEVSYELVLRCVFLKFYHL